MFDQIDWLKVLNVEQVDLIITTTVINELDKHKDGHSSVSIKVSTRAKKIVRRLYNYMGRWFKGILY
ncbi:MAG: PIN domain-containing protein [Crocosphaera sp.]